MTDGRDHILEAGHHEFNFTFDLPMRYIFEQIFTIIIQNQILPITNNKKYINVNQIYMYNSK